MEEEVSWENSVKAGSFSALMKAARESDRLEESVGGQVGQAGGAGNQAIRPGRQEVVREGDEAGGPGQGGKGEGKAGGAAGCRPRWMAPGHAPGKQLSYSHASTGQRHTHGEQWRSPSKAALPAAGTASKPKSSVERPSA